MRLKLLILLIIFSSLASGMAAFLAYRAVNAPIEAKNIPMQLKVSENPAVNIDTDALYFGGVPPAGSSMRQISIFNGKIHSVKVVLLAKGELAPWAYISENSILLRPNETAKANVTIVVPSDAKLGNYTGSLLVELYKG